MLMIWDLHGPPSFVTLAAAHLDPKKRKKKRPPAEPKKTKTASAGPPPEDGTGTMGDLAAFMGLGKKGKKKVVI
jgi:hypothetical protein